MKYTKIILIAILLLSLTSLPTKQVQITQPEPQKVQTKELDGRAKVLAGYFAKYNSPFEYHAQDFIDAADTYGVDWKLVPAISGVESTFGKASFGYNAWGWGIYGDQTLNFGSWRDGIFTVTSGLKTGYINKGLTDPISMNRIYATSPTWGGRVNYFMKDLDKFASLQEPTPAPAGHPSTKTAVSSAELAYKN